MACPLLQDSFWLSQLKFEDAEAQYQKIVAGNAHVQGQAGTSSLAMEIAQTRQLIKNALNNPADRGDAPDSQVNRRLDNLEQENRGLKKVTQDLKSLVQKLEGRIKALEVGGAAPSAASAAADKDADEDFDLFGDEDEDEEEVAEDLERKKLLEEYKAKKSKKPVIIAKSNIILEVKPWDDETDMKHVEKLVRAIKADGLLWGTSKLVPLAYGINKLQISCVVEDDKIGTDFLEEEITKHEDFIQSIDIVGFNKI
ncbi:elongation factor 1-delta-like [Gigantopelta aegis]|uniref:elongation factor 1-delta-like n=1 Tax=Gigantopelta aegis TaxID=1735272 RepID=UPI001B88B131|nr:elongation factor 1-delta-like [Gigantopelta aegis]